MCGGREEFLHMDDSAAGKVDLASDASTEIKGKGSVSLIANVDGTANRVTLSDVLHVPGLRTNLLSVGKICDKGFKVIFEKGKASILNAKGEHVVKAQRGSGGLYFLNTKYNEERSANAEINGNTII